VEAVVVTPWRHGGGLRGPFGRSFSFVGGPTFFEITDGIP
jgi:hypothetical protein